MSEKQKSDFSVLTTCVFLCVSVSRSLFGCYIAVISTQRPPAAPTNKLLWPPSLLITYFWLNRLRLRTKSFWGSLDALSALFPQDSFPRCACFVGICFNSRQLDHEIQTKPWRWADLLPDCTHTYHCDQSVLFLLKDWNLSHCDIKLTLVIP